MEDESGVESVENLSNCNEVLFETTEVESASFIMLVLFLLYVSSVISHFISSAKVGKNGEDRWWVLCLPDSMVTLILGMVLGGFVCSLNYDSTQVQPCIRETASSYVPRC